MPACFLKPAGKQGGRRRGGRRWRGGGGAYMQRMGSEKDGRMKDHSHNKMLGAHELAPETLMLGYGYDPALSEGSVKPPVFLTSTFVFKSAEDGAEFFDYVAGRREPPAGEA